MINSLGPLCGPRKGFEDRCIIKGVEMLEEDSFQIDVILPYPILEIERRYNTKVSISKVCQRGIINGYGVHKGWMISVYIISDVCTYCGELRYNIGKAPNHEKCTRHRWAARSQALLLFHTIGDTYSEAMKNAGDKAGDFLKDPESWDWEIEIFMSRQEYLKYLKCE